MSDMLNEKEIHVINRTVTTSFLIFLVFLLQACSSGSDSSTVVEGTVTLSEITVNQNVSDKVAAKSSVLYKIPVISDQSYSVVLQSLAGDADLAIRGSEDLDTISNIYAYSIIDNSIKEATPDKVVFTSPIDGFFYIEVNGFSASEYYLEVKSATDTDIGFTLSEHDLYFTSILPDIISEEQSVNVTTMVLQSAAVLDAGSLLLLREPESEAWLKADLETSTTLPKYSMLDISIKNTILDPGVYKTRVALQSDVLLDPTRNVYRTINVEYQVARMDIPEVMTGRTLDVQINTSPQSGLDYSIAYGPVNMSIDALNRLTWSNVNPLFGKDMTFSFGIHVSGSNIDTIFDSSFTVSGENDKPPLASYGTVLNDDLVIGDFDNDSHPEVLVGEGGYLYTMQYDGTGYRRDWSYPYHLGENRLIREVDAIDLDNDGYHELILVIGNNTEIYIMDGKSRDITRTISSGYFDVWDYTSGDVNGDGIKDAIILLRDHFGDRIQIVDLKNGTILWESVPDDYGTEITAGNIDADGDLEIVLRKGHIIDTSDFTIEPPFVSGFFLRGLVDEDNDGIHKILYELSNTLYVYDAINAISVATPGIDASDIFVGNVDQFPGDEVLIYNFTEQLTYTYRLDGVTNQLTLEPGISAFNSRIYDSQSYDFDGDGINEIVTPLNTHSTASDVLQVISVVPGFNVEYGYLDQFAHVPPYYGGVGLSSTSGERKVGYFIENSSSYDVNGLATTSGAIFMLWDDVNKSFEVSANYIAPVDHNTAMVTDYNHDMNNEVIVAQDYLGTFVPYVHVMDATSFVVQDVLDMDAPERNVNALGTGDINGDGNDDLIAITFLAERVGLDMKYERGLLIYDLHSQAVIKSHVLNNKNGQGGFSIKVSNLDGDGDVEVVLVYDQVLPDINSVTGPKMEVLSLNSSGDIINRHIRVFEGDFKDYTIDDFDDNGTKEIAVLRRVWNGLAYTTEILFLDPELETINHYELDTDFHTMHIENIAGQNRNIVLSGKDASAFNHGGYLRAVDAMSGATVWQSPMLMGWFQPNSLNFSDLDGDGIYQAYFATDMAMYATQ